MFLSEKLSVDAETVRHGVEGLMYLLAESAKLMVCRQGLLLYRVRSFSFAGSTPVCGNFFSPGRHGLLSAHVCPGKNHATHRVI